ncbi:hypothetical protein ACTMSW_29495 [Micromonospora sp. BQ11]|uniref:hypothetical protein n=1 Tax=Micromonospora sp. BQ11 TaxID=3452212 RepID=UPI003F896D83
MTMGSAKEAQAAGFACEMPSGSALHHNERLTSCGSEAQSLVLQQDGNLVLYRHSDGVALWHSSTHGRAVTKAVMQTDGNFVLYGADMTPHWYSGTQGFGGAVLRLQDSGGLSITVGGFDVWSGDRGFTDELHVLDVNNSGGIQLTFDSATRPGGDEATGDGDADETTDIVPKDARAGDLVRVTAVTPGGTRSVIYTVVADRSLLNVVAEAFKNGVEVGAVGFGIGKVFNMGDDGTTVGVAAGTTGFVIGTVSGGISEAAKQIFFPQLVLREGDHTKPGFIPSRVFPVRGYWAPPGNGQPGRVIPFDNR